MPGAYLLNLISDAVTITPSSEDTAYPKANLYDRISAKVFRSTSKTTLTILLDFGAAVAADTIAIVNHNLTSGATLSLRAGSGSPPSTVVATPTYRQYDLWKSFASVSARYWLLTITDINTANIQIGQLLLGVRVALPRARRIGESYKESDDNHVIGSETYGGVDYSYHLFNRAILNPSFRVLGSEIETLRTLHKTVHGKVTPFLYIPDVDAAACYYMKKEPSFEPVEFSVSQNQSVWDYTMTLAEESRGLEVLE